MRAGEAPRTARHIIRVMLRTRSGSRYAVWYRPDVGWWLRLRPRVGSAGDPLDVEWRPIEPPIPWPPQPGEVFRFCWLRAAFGGYIRERWRITSPVATMRSWQERKLWPGDPTPDR